MNNIQIAIDGPSGAGKSTIAKIIARTLGILYLDTGAMYRTVALKGLRSGVCLSDGDAVAGMLRDTRIDVVYRDGSQRVLLDGEDVSDDIRTNEVSMGASAVSAHLVVRERLVSLQQDIARRISVIMDGRDIGTKVLPNADIKIFLTASPEARAKRRFQELQEKGSLDMTYAALLEEIRTRDQNDSGRIHSPLVKADDAFLLDTTDFGLEEATKAVLALIEARME